ncbi:MAG: signal recognition particle-docking protein FtsY [Spirochaetaceae bacterium]|nr:MAG: signal recognition particle-docking protein FtsY [Spirochaetaceae bacterium]
MKKTGLGAKIRALFTGSKIDEALIENLEDILIEADVGSRLAAEIVGDVEAMAGRGADRDTVMDVLAKRVSEGLRAVDLRPDPEADVTLYLILGVNGTGKTTSCAKLARYYRDVLGVSGVVLAAGDTFRAAAVQQLVTHGERLGIRVVQQGQNADPASVIFDALASAKSRGERLVIADTAGRMHTRADLVGQLAKIDKVVRRQIDPAHYRKVMVIDSTTGQNGYRQAELFHEAVGVDAAILAKYDSTAKGGIAVQISRSLGIPFAFLGTGETYESLQPFSVDDYLRRLIGDPVSTGMDDDVPG